jgi:sulfatase maturation enzyme AslB (radical SAM superfamily)
MKIIPILNQTVKKFPKKNIQNLMCLDPFNSISIDISGNASMCSCQMWHPTIIGNVLETSVVQMLSSDLAHDIRNSIRNGTFEYCDETRCGIMINDRLLPTDKLFDREKEKFFNPDIVDTPKYVYIAGDQTCNLSCPSCRTHVINNDDEVVKKNKTVMSVALEQIFNKSSEDPVSVTIGTYGEIFASRDMLNFLEKFPITRYPKLELTLQSNGLLIKSRWDRVKHLANNLYRLSITLDSQNPKTYEKLRRGGTFEKILENLVFVKELKKQHNFEYSIRMVVQKDNMDEIEEFYNFATFYGADEVEYLRILDWGVYPPGIFQDLDVLDINNQYYDRTIKQLRNLKNKHDNVVLYHFTV